MSKWDGHELAHEKVSEPEQAMFTVGFELPGGFVLKDTAIQAKLHPDCKIAEYSNGVVRLSLENQIIYLTGTMRLIAPEEEAQEYSCSSAALQAAEKQGISVEHLDEEFYQEDE